MWFALAWHCTPWLSTHLRKAKLTQKRALSWRKLLSSLLGTFRGIAAAIYQANKYYNKLCYHNSKLTGKGWLAELFNGNPQRFKDQLGMQRHVFKKLVATLFRNTSLHNSRYVSLEEQVAIFCYTTVTNLSNRKVAEHFQRSGDTISHWVFLWPYDFFFFFVLGWGLVSFPFSVCFHSVWNMGYQADAVCPVYICTYKRTLIHSIANSGTEQHRLRLSCLTLKWRPLRTITFRYLAFSFSWLNCTTISGVANGTIEEQRKQYGLWGTPMLVAFMVTSCWIKAGQIEGPSKSMGLRFRYIEISTIPPGDACQEGLRYHASQRLRSRLSRDRVGDQLSKKQTNHSRNPRALNTFSNSFAASPPLIFRRTGNISASCNSCWR